ncbi:uncharacterized protein MELLADRAFT_78438 [Melampsora larici-populina 98AG31]|uniref:Uncharacterized protein n=1 Tax=Melampsora larici-populina (strain 98AG31 / pathotype 3-4-7) TaxID=747676 RepID=F4RUB4_MELLP|nr:uncharacterized protein MELLADRAFT_78438 [Melampsora larici-populina 98AG31]EGG03906.1 hypothetical protein MELLADRAFT_78438 [Melampsora larici-populina 98AG31]
MPETVEVGHSTGLRKRLGGMSSSEVIETENNHLTVTKNACPTISSDTIEQLHTSSPGTTPPPVLSQRSPIPQQTLFSLGIDLDSQCSPLTYQVLHPKDKIRSVNRGHGGWLEANQDPHSNEPAEDDLFNCLPAPVAKQSRHRVVSDELLCLPGDLGTSQSRNQGIVLENTTDQQGCDAVILPIPTDNSTGQHEAECHPDRDRTQHTPKSRVLCEASPTPKRLSTPAKQHENSIHLFDPGPCVVPSLPRDKLAPRSLRSISPLEHLKDPKTISVDDDMLQSSPVPAQSQDGDKTLFFPESMALGISDWEDLGRNSPSPPLLSRVEEVIEQATTPTPRRSGLIPGTQLGKDIAYDSVLSIFTDRCHLCDPGFLDERGPVSSPIPPSKVILAEETQEMTPERPSKGHNLLTELIEGSPVLPSHVLAEETQELSPEPPSKRTKTLDRPSQSSSHRKPLIRSLAPPTPISVRTRQQQEMSALKERRTLSKSVNSTRVASSNVSAHKARTPSPLKKVKNVGSWKERNRQAWTTNPDAQIINSPFDRQSNITEFFNQPGPSTSSMSTTQKSKEIDSVSQAGLTKALLQETAMNRLFGNISPIRKTNPDHLEENDEIEDIDVDIMVPDSQIIIEGQGCDDSQDEKETGRIDFEKYLERKRYRIMTYGFDQTQNLMDQEEIHGRQREVDHRFKDTKDSRVDDDAHADELVSDDFDVHF